MSDASTTFSTGPSSERSAQSHEIPDQARDDEVGQAADPSVTGRDAAGATSPSQVDGEDRKRTPRHNEWTRAKMVAFLRELAASQSVAQAARSVGMSRQSAYRMRNRMVGTPFALGWEVALEAGMQQLAHAVMDRAVNGVEVPHYYHGELVGTSRHFDERLAIWMLDNPWKIGRQQIAREYVAEGFDALLERIEWASLEWEEGESLPSRCPPVDDRSEGEARENAFVKRSWYAAAAGEGEGAGSRKG